MTELEMYKKVSEDLDIDLEKVMEYDKFHWWNIKINLNNPTFRVLEVPMFGSFTITLAKLKRSLRYSITLLKRLRKKAIKHPDVDKVQMDLISQKELFKKLWKIRDYECI